MIANTTPPSSEVSEAALADARRLATGLYPHQVEGVAFLLARRRSILADDMGLGKTRQAIVAMRQSAPAGPWLVVCPASVKFNWEREIRMVDETCPVQVLAGKKAPKPDPEGWIIVNYDVLGALRSKLELIPFEGFIYDEAHYLKNHKSQRSKHARELVAQANDPVLHALTGTPMTSRPRDLFPLLQLIGHPMGKSFLSFAKRYCDAYHNEYGWVTDGASNLEELSTQLHGSLIRRTKDEVLDLPGKVRHWLPVQVKPGTAAKETMKVVQTLMAGQARQARGKDSRGKARPETPGVDRSRLIADITKARVAISKAKVKTAIEFVEGILEQGEKVIVFSCFDEPVQKITEHFGEQARKITGATAAKKRQAIVDEFQNDDEVRVLCANLIAGGVGINLTAASQVVFTDLDWVPANHWQAEDRAYRIGQTRSVTAHYLVAENTIDTFVHQVLEIKSALIEAVIDGKAFDGSSAGVLEELEKAIGNLGPQLAELSSDEIDEDTIHRLIREASKEISEDNPAEEAAAEALKNLDLPEHLVQLLAAALGGPKSQTYRVTSNSDSSMSYRLEVDSGGDVICNCPGFEYRGACSHGRKLKEALANGGQIPAAYVPEQN